MSQSYYLKRDKRSWQYKNASFPYARWSFFTDRETDLPSIEKFFSQISDSFSLSFVNDDMKPANYFEVLRRGNRIEVTLNGGERQFTMRDYDLVPLEEQVKFYFDRSSEEINRESEKYQKLDRIEYYRNNANEETLKELQDLIQSRMSDDELLRDKLSGYDADRKSEIYFLDS